MFLVLRFLKALFRQINNTKLTLASVEYALVFQNAVLNKNIVFRLVTADLLSFFSFVQMVLIVIANQADHKPSIPVQSVI